jgi:hypothetical protein
LRYVRPPRRAPIQFLPVALLLLGIAVHGVRIEAYNEDPQRGSAFAMFSTVDIGTTRRVIATVPSDTAITLDIPDALEGQRARLADTPSDDSARRLANRLLDLTWKVDGHTATVGDGARFDQVRVQVVGLDADGRTVSRRVLTDVVVRNSG